MWHLENPWYEISARSASIFLAVMIIMRFWGKKHFSEMNPFDFVLLLICSETLQNALVDDEKSVTGGIISIGTLILMNVLFNRLGFYSRRMEKMIDGTPKILIKGGKIDEKLMRKECLTMQELHAALRQEGIMEPSEVQWGIIETNGKISVIKKDEKSS
ncbi:MAG: DUF421 domain-containing protein [Bacteriovoracaceae bacterium]